MTAVLRLSESDLACPQKHNQRCGFQDFRVRTTCRTEFLLLTSGYHWGPCFPAPLQNLFCANVSEVLKFLLKYFCHFWGMARVYSSGLHCFMFSFSCSQECYVRKRQLEELCWGSTHFRSYESDTIRQRLFLVAGHHWIQFKWTVSHRPISSGLGSLFFCI